MAQLSYVVYVSKMTFKALASPNTFCDLLTHAQAYNKDAGLSGFLCHGNQYFFQYVEGGRDEIEELCEHLEKDKRHRGMRILDRNTLDAKLFQDWDMFAITFDRFVTRYASAHPFMPFVPYDWSQVQTTEFVAMFRDYYEHHDGHYAQNIDDYCLESNRLAMSQTKISNGKQWLTFTSVISLIVILSIGLVIYNFNR